MHKSDQKSGESALTLCPFTVYPIGIKVRIRTDWGGWRPWIRKLPYA
jgi:hypothetical protein